MDCPGCGSAFPEVGLRCPSCGRRRAGDEGDPPPARPAFLTVVALLEMLAAFFCLAVGGLVALSLTIGPRLLEAPPPDERRFTVIVAAVLLVAGAWQLLAAIGLWKLTRWGRWAQVGLSCVGLLAVPFGTVLHGILLIYLFRPAVRNAFGRGAPAETAGGKLASTVALLLTFALLVVAVALPPVSRKLDRDRQQRTRRDVASIGIAVESYQVDNGFPPHVLSSDNAAAALRPFLQPTFIELLPLHDGWGQPIHWRAGADGYSIYSYGKDGVPGPRTAYCPTPDARDDLYFSGAWQACGGTAN